MAEELRLHAFWPTMLFTTDWDEHARHAPALTAFLYALESAQKAPIDSGIAVGAKARQGLSEGDLGLFERAHPALDALKRFIGRSVQQAVARANGGRVKPGAIRVEVTDSWYHITRDRGFHDAHAHPGCSWCGIYYLQVGDSGPVEGGAPNGLNRFYCPISTGGMVSDYGAAYLNAGYVDPPVRDGMLILFPAHLQHSGLPYAGSRDRLIISFNSRSYLGPKPS